MPVGIIRTFGRRSFLCRQKSARNAESAMRLSADRGAAVSVFLFIAFPLFQIAGKITGAVFIFAVVVWNWIDFILAATGNMKDGEKKEIKIW